MKKIASMALVLILALALTVPALAATTYTISVETGNTHQYEVYQIFTGDFYNEAGVKILSNVKWGKNGTGNEGNSVDESVLTALKALNAEGKSNRDKLNVILQYAKLDSDAYGVVNSSTPLNNVPAGYYLIKDVDGEYNGKYDAYTTYIVQVAGDVVISPKTGVPTVDKKIIDGSNESKTGDYNIGDDVTFRLTGTLPANYDDYASYKYVFHDTLSAGLTYNNESARVYVKNGDADPIEVTDSFNVSPSEDGRKLDISCDNLKTIVIENVTINKDSKIIVEYNAKLNANAEIGNPGNKNEVYLEFSNNPNWDGNGDKPTGNTPKDEVIVFTFELDVTKVDASDNKKKLSGAEFKLRNADGKWVTVDTNSKVTGWSDTEAGGSTLTTGDDGLIRVIGLEEGTYKLKETKAPNGYNLLEAEITIVIDAEYNEQGGLTKLTIKVGDGSPTDGVIDSGIVGMTVENNKGSTLPETGGIGTTIFYVAGGVLVVGALIVLITKKRMAAK